MIFPMRYFLPAVMSVALTQRSVAALRAARYRLDAPQGSDAP